MTTPTTIAELFDPEEVNKLLGLQFALSDAVTDAALNGLSLGCIDLVMKSIIQDTAALSCLTPKATPQEETQEVPA